MTTRGGLARTEERLKAIARHEDAGMTIRESAALLGVTERTVSRLRLRRRGYKIQLRPGPTPEQLRLFEALLDEGWPYAEIGRTHGFCEQTIARYFPGRGWDRSRIGQHGAAGKLMNAIPDFAEPAKRDNFASLKVGNPNGPRHWHATGHQRRQQAAA